MQAALGYPVPGHVITYVWGGLGARGDMLANPHLDDAVIILLRGDGAPQGVWQEELVDLLARVLPYSEQAITAKLGEFLVESRELRGFGFLAFLLTALTAFGMIENSINDIWRVTRRRAFRSQLSSFVLLLCWGPILIGATYSVLFLLRKSPAFGSLTETFLLSWAPFLVTLVGLTMLNWQVPRTAVRFGSAFAGGAVSALLVEVIRSGFAFYVARADQISIVYSSFGFVFFFVVSIQLTWLIVLAGTELAYCVQNFDYMSRRGVSVGVVEGSWLGLAAMVLVTERFHRGTPITSRELLAQKLDLDAGELHGTLLHQRNFTAEALNSPSFFANLSLIKIGATSRQSCCCFSGCSVCSYPPSEFPSFFPGRLA